MTYEIVARYEPIMCRGLIHSDFLTFWSKNSLLWIKKEEEEEGGGRQRAFCSYGL